MEFRVLGPVRVLADGNDLPINGLRRKALLAMLVVHCAEVVPVGRMVEELWNGSPPPGAMGTLKSHVHQLRRVLAVENLVAARAGGYVLQADRSQVDAFEFERQVAAARAARDRGDLAAAGPAFEAALALFRGQPLTDVADLDFAVREARRLNQLALDASEDRFEVALALGRHTAVLTELETLAGAHPLRERLIGQLMVSLYRCGRQADALAVYRTTRAQLLEQLGIDPGHELQALERAILDQADELDPPRRPATVPPAPPSATAPDRAPIDRRDAVPFPLTTSGLLPFVGRETELAELADQWRAVTGGERRAVIISGEPGIGKTRQAAELAGFVAEDGGTVLYGACDEELGVPYQPFAEALRRHLRRVGFRLPTVHHGLDGELTRLLPELPRLIPDLPPPTDTDPESQRYLLFDAVAATLAGIAAETPTLLVIEDIHWATRSTLLLLRHLLSSSEPTALLVVATRRDVEAPTTESRDLLAALTRLPLVLRLELGLLGGDEARSLVESVHEAPLDPRRLDRLLADAQGNPFFLTELIRHVGQAAGTAASEGVAPSSASSPTDLPAGIRDLIDRRTAHLSGPPEVLTAAAVLGSTFDLGTLARTVDRSAPPDAVTSVVDEGVRLGLLRPDGPGRFAFAHDLVRRHLSTRVGPAGRVAVHLRVGLAVEQLSRPGERLEALAHHFTEAATGGGGVKALSYSMAAAERALTQTDFEQGAGLIRRAIDATRADPSIPASLMAEGYECLALTVLPTSTGSFAAHRSACREAAEWARSAGSAEALAVAAIEALRWSQADTFEPEIEALAAEALARRDELPEPLAALLVARSAFYRSTLEGYGPPLEGASREALSVARASGAPEAMREAIVARYWSIFSTPKADERLALGEELLHLPDGPVLRSRAARMHRGYEAPTDRCFRALARLELGDRDGFEEDLLVLDASGERSGVAASRSTLWHGLLLLLDGRFGEADRLVNAMRAKALDANYAASYAGQLAELRYQQGRLPELASLMASAVRPGPRPGGRQAIAALAHAQAGQPTTARTLLATLAVDDFARVPRDLSWTATLSWASEAAAVLAEPDTAASLYRLLRPHHGRAVVAAWGVVCRGAFDRYLGMLASTSGEIGAAREHYEAALRLEERLRSAPSLARTRYWFGRSLLDAGDDRDRRRADGLLRMARATAESLGMGRLVSDIDRLVIRHIRN